MYFFFIFGGDDYQCVFIYLFIFGDDDDQCVFDT